MTRKTKPLHTCSEQCQSDDDLFDDGIPPADLRGPVEVTTLEPRDEYDVLLDGLLVDSLMSDQTEH